ncbi:SpoIIE family protein phosphatase [Streptomyces wuyuanensis]|uniref:SpoIIE family protein phosphatase n=1 Tax=Streptomyces wuyuanensis TaxID=1196353 RepID=UPI0037189F3B
MTDVPPAPPAPGPGPAGGGPQPVLSLALAGMMDEVEAHAGAVYLLSPDGRALEMAVMAGLPRAFAAPWERVGISAPIPVADAARDRRLVWVGGEEEMAARYPRIAVVLPYPFSLAALPVATDDTVYGAVFVTWPGAHPPELSDREREHLTAACERLALRLRRICETGGPLRTEPDILGDRQRPSGTAATEAVHLLERIPEGLCSLDLNGRITFLNPAAADLLGLAPRQLQGRQLWGALPWLNDPVYEDRYRAALISQQPTSFVALRPPRDWLSFRLHPGTTGISVRIAPARTDRGTERSPAKPSPPRLVAISHVLSLAGGLTEAVGVDDVIRMVGAEFMPAVGCRSLVVLTAEAGRLSVVGHRGHDDPHIVERFHGTPLTAHTPGTQALVTGVPSFFGSRRELEQVYPASAGTRDGMAAWAYLPLVASGRTVGACVLGYAEPHHFSPDDRAVLTSLVSLIAQALERARLYDAKHRLAHGLQAALMQHSLPRVPGLEHCARYLPATRGLEIGGDFYDLIRVPGAGPAAVVGDVQGHNVAAAGLMGQVRTAIRAFTAVGRPPGEVMAGTNRLLMDLGADLFVSCVYVHLDPANRRALIARAGHPHPLLRAPDGSVSVLDVPGGTLLGVDARASYPATEVPLPHGSVLALYTDGLIELPDADFDEELAGLGDHFAHVGGGILEEVADSLVAHTAQTHERADDVALLLLRLTGAMPPGAAGG